MTEQRLIEELRSRAAEDAAAFREQYPDDTPSERWIENSYTAALPLAKDRSGFNPGLGPHPQLFEAYGRAVLEALGR